MKNLISLYVALTFALTTAFATTPEIILSSDEVEVTANKINFVEDVAFDLETNNLSFSTKENIATIMVFNANGEMEMVIPVLAKNVQLSKNLFSEGSYKIGFLLEGESEVNYTQVTFYPNK